MWRQASESEPFEQREGRVLFLSAEFRLGMQVPAKRDEFAIVAVDIIRQLVAELAHHHVDEMFCLDVVKKPWNVHVSNLDTPLWRTGKEPPTLGTAARLPARERGAGLSSHPARRA